MSPESYNTLGAHAFSFHFISGAGGNRTLVRTRKPYAFYTLIPAFGFRSSARPGPPTDALSSKFHQHTEACASYFRFTCTAISIRFGTTSIERCLVLPPCRRIKLIIYYASIKQRERTLFRQLNFRPKRLWSLQSPLRVLTYHFVSPSNPVNPMAVKSGFPPKTATKVIIYF